MPACRPACGTGRSPGAGRNNEKIYLIIIPLWRGVDSPRVFGAKTACPALDAGGGVLKI